MDSKITAIDVYNNDNSDDDYKADDDFQLKIKSEAHEKDSRMIEKVFKM